MKLAILICTLPEEYSIGMLKRLNNILDPQIERFPGQVSKYIHDAGRSMPTGTKRNQLIQNSDSEYFVFIDCDDIIPAYYVHELMTAIEHGPDVITFIGYMTTDGGRRKDFVIRLGSDYRETANAYLRWPNHLCCFKRSVVEGVRFQDIWVQEDYYWSKAIRDRGLLKSEIHLQKDMYVYDFRSNKPKRSYA